MIKLTPWQVDQLKLVLKPMIPYIDPHSLANSQPITKFEFMVEDILRIINR